MSENRLKILCDLVSEVHAQIQKDFADINPVVGVSQKMRDIGVPADAMTIDCLKSGKRIILVLHDQQPEMINYQFSFKSDDPSDEFEQLEFKALTFQVVYDWIKNYFSSAVN